MQSARGPEHVLHYLARYTHRVTHARNTCVFAPHFIPSCRRARGHCEIFEAARHKGWHVAPHQALPPYLIMERSPPLKTHSPRLSRRTHQRLTSHDFIRSARRSTPAFTPVAPRRAPPIKIWRDPRPTASTLLRSRSYGWNSISVE